MIKKRFIMCNKNYLARKILVAGDITEAIETIAKDTSIFFNECFHDRSKQENNSYLIFLTWYLI